LYGASELWTGAHSKSRWYDDDDDMMPSKVSHSHNQQHFVGIRFLWPNGVSANANVDVIKNIDFEKCSHVISCLLMSISRPVCILLPMCHKNLEKSANLMRSGKWSACLLCSLFYLLHRSLLFCCCSYTLRCTMTDDWGKVHLAFDLEVVKVVVHKVALTGVYRKRVKGDAWHYKKLCEDILSVAMPTDDNINSGWDSIIDDNVFTSVHQYANDVVNNACVHCDREYLDIFFVWSDREYAHKLCIFGSCMLTSVTGFSCILESLGFVPGFSRSWNVLENHFCAGN